MVAVMGMRRRRGAITAGECKGGGQGGGVNNWTRQYGSGRRERDKEEEG